MSTYYDLLPEATIKTNTRKMNTSAVTIAHQCNSHELIEAALTNPVVGMLEIDVRVSSDNILYLTHDSEIIINGDTYYVEELRKDTLHKAGLISLQKGLDTISSCKQASNKLILLDIKTPFMYGYSCVVDPLLELINNNMDLIQNRCIISSFDQRIVNSVRKVYPTIDRSIIFCGLRQQFLEDALTLGCTYVQVHYEVLNKDLLQEAHNKSIKVLVFTVNKRRTHLKLLETGLVYGIITDVF